MTRQIPLGKGRFALVDDEDYDRVAQRSWEVTRRVGRGDCTQYAMQTEQSLVEGGHRLMHRFILGLEGSTPPVDHRDGDGLNNTRGNLRPCTHAENTRNRRKYRPMTSQYKGVSAHKDRWDVYVSDRFCGRFKNELSAAIAYDRCAAILHGDFSHPNFAPGRDWILFDIDHVAIARAVARATARGCRVRRRVRSRP